MAFTVTKSIKSDFTSITKKEENDGSLWECELDKFNPETQKLFTSEAEVASFIDYVVGKPNYWRVAYKDEATKKEAEKPFYEESVRFERNELLDRYQWTETADLTTDEKAAWKTYKQALRDLPKQSGFPYDVTWPTKPD